MYSSGREMLRTRRAVYTGAGGYGKSLYLLNLAVNLKLKTTPRAIFKNGDDVSIKPQASIANIHVPFSVSATAMISLTILVNAHKSLRKCCFCSHFTVTETGRTRFSDLLMKL